jgi:manganese-dependent inorganic pyrophosphatase
MDTYVVGHKNPDTDSVVAAIAFTDFEKAMGKECRPAVAGPVNKETDYVLRTFNVAEPVLVPDEEKKVIVVDVNEPSQLADNVKPEEIVGIVDHHKLGGLSTAEPIYVRIEPVGSSSTLVARMFRTEDVEVTEVLAKLLIAGILSDTLNFTSPTTTDSDREMAWFLNETANVDFDSLAEQMFKAKSDLTGVSSEALVTADYKVFDMGGKKVGIGVFETVHPDSALDRKDEIIEILAKKKSADGLDHIFLSVVDIMGEAAFTLTASEEDFALVKRAFESVERDGVLFLPGIVSRKKQIVPAIEKALS